MGGFVAGVNCDDGRKKVFDRVFLSDEPEHPAAMALPRAWRSVRAVSTTTCVAGASVFICSAGHRAVAVGELEVHQDDVGLIGTDGDDGLGHGPGRSDDVDLR